MINKFLSFFWRYMSFFRYFFPMLIYNWFWIVLLWIFWIVCNFFNNFMTNQITSCFCCFRIPLFEAVLKAFAVDYLTWSKDFWLYLLLNFFTYIFTNNIIHIFLKRQKSIAFSKYSISSLNLIALWSNAFYLLSLVV